MITEETVVRRIEGLLRITAAPWCVRCRGKMIENGHDRYSNQRFRCVECRTTTGYGVSHRSVKRIRAIELFRQGLSLRTVCRIVGLQKATATKYRRSVAACPCPCGQDSKHRGWCWYRYQNSPKRQEFMKRWHSKAV